MAQEMKTLGLGFTWEQLSVGQRFRTLNRTVTETDGKAILIRMPK